MLSLRELQMLAEAQYTVEKSREDLGELTDFCRSLPGQDEYIDVAFVKERKLPYAIAEEQKVFFLPEEIVADSIPEKYWAESLGFIKNGRVVFAGRVVYPVFDVYGNVMGFCGWDKFERPKYLDSKNHGYKAKESTVYGMERLAEYYTSSKPVYIVEGIVCCLYLRSVGLQSLALLGSHLSPYVVQVIRRFGRRAVFIPDNDAYGKTAEEIGSMLSGEHFVWQTKKMLPDATVVQSMVAKDIDDTRRIDGIEPILLRELSMVCVNPFLSLSTLRLR